MSYFDRFLDLIDTLPHLIIYVVLGISAFVENIFPPAPGDTFVALGAFLVATGRLHFFGVFISTTLGSLAGFMFLFWLGRVLGRRFFIEKDYRYFRAEKIMRAEEWFKRYGYYLILLNRFFPGVRSVISIAGGISGLQALKVALLAFLSCSVWNSIWIGLGYSLGSNWETAKTKINTILSSYNITVLVLLCLIFMVYWIRKKKKH